MTAFVVLAGGRGTRAGRVGDGLHKALLPLDGRAVLSRLFDLAPRAARLVVCLGYKGDQLREYVQHAHPKLDVTFVDDPWWDHAGSGPGTGLLAAREVVGDDALTFTSCDTLWRELVDVDHDAPDVSWMGVAAVPAGTDPMRWCRVTTAPDGDVVDVLDKRAGYADQAYVGLGHVAREDLRIFWKGIVAARDANARLAVDARTEVQVSDGFTALLDAQRPIRARHVVDWLDVGDAVAYRDAVARSSGYDWAKTGEATYVLPDTGRVVKYFTAPFRAHDRAYRAHVLGVLDGVVPGGVVDTASMMSYAYVPGKTLYEALDEPDVDAPRLTRDLLAWRERSLTRCARASLSRQDVLRFYRDKTYDRVNGLGREELFTRAYDAVRRVDFDTLADHAVSGYLHGDLNFGNVLLTRHGGGFVAIDWREDFANLPYGDVRYDVAKLLAGTVVHWGRARRGDFGVWELGDVLGDVIRDWIDAHPVTCGALEDVEVIGALSLLNCAPLHAPPLDEVLVARGCAWLQEVT